ncbi:hypothetical protein Tco_0595935 [Tanacetum coccineum]
MRKQQVLDLVLGGNQRVEFSRLFVLDNVKANKLLMSVQAPFLNVQMMSVHISSGLVLHQMTSDHNRSELGIQDHSNEQSSSKLVPKVVP